MIKLLNAKPLGMQQLELHFSNQTHGIFDGAAYLAARRGPLLEDLRDPAYFARCFIEAGALCWPNGLELSAARLKEMGGGMRQLRAHGAAGDDVAMRGHPPSP